MEYPLVRLLGPAAPLIVVALLAGCVRSYGYTDHVTFNSDRGRYQLITRPGRLVFLYTTEHPGADGLSYETLPLRKWNPEFDRVLGIHELPPFAYRQQIAPATLFRPAQVRRVMAAPFWAILPIAAVMAGVYWYVWGWFLR